MSASLNVHVCVCVRSSRSFPALVELVLSSEKLRVSSGLNPTSTAGAISSPPSAHFAYVGKYVVLHCRNALLTASL